MTIYNHINSIWTSPEAHRILNEGAGSGATATAIAGRLAEAGFPVTRSAVIGKLRRPGISLKAARRASGVVPPPPKPKKVRPKAIDGAPLPDSPSQFQKRLERSFSGVGIPLENITTGLCVWPLAVGFCGAAVEEGQSYCTGHCNEAYAARKAA